MVSCSKDFPLLIFHNQAGSMPLLTGILFGACQQPSWAKGGVLQGAHGREDWSQRTSSEGAGPTQPKQGFDQDGSSCKCLLHEKSSQGSAGGSVVKNPPASEGDSRLISSPGRSLMPQSH